MASRDPVESGSDGIRDGTLPKTTPESVDRWHPEAAYFTAFDGERTAFFVVDLPDRSLMPPLAEPLLSDLHAEVHLAPAMNLEDLQRRLAQPR